jgi:hypothetical protein
MQRYDSDWIDKAVFDNVFLNQIDKILSHYATIPSNTLIQHQAVFDYYTSTVRNNLSVSL